MEAPTEYRPDPSVETSDNKQRAIELELDSGDSWTGEGRDVTYLDDQATTPPRNQHGETPPNPGKRPDQLVDGEFRDVFSPTTSSAESAVKNALRKVSQGQAQRIDVILDPARTPVSAQDFIDAFNRDFRHELDSVTFSRPGGTAYPVEEITVLHNGQRIVVYTR